MARSSRPPQQPEPVTLRGLLRQMRQHRMHMRRRLGTEDYRRAQRAMLVPSSYLIFGIVSAKNFYLG
jgi:hypothetical protein